MIVREATHNDIPAIAKVHVDTWRTTYRGIVPDEHLANLSYERRGNRWHEILNHNRENGYFTYVAEDESGEIIGFASGGEERTGDPVYQGELTAIYILQNQQGKGIGRCLVQAVAKKLHLSGINSMLVWVLVDNPACQFYAALGGKPVHEKEIEIGGKPLIEVAYGWMETGNLRGCL
ncbi:GNAT family N-acetyltransferase [Calothrix sp. NIES-3974]|uniref:GNAT family N-acetyltransferase n=1 Tax=Calothrix sp. NIES-3974 TaxID=2005462 RepID=UPI000B614767|nr:GNAT family N-acetyltransferase [Calothrix sp. NIES-3974]BAZ06174.1 GCN5-related N-acetyltransferase [Calothrix sp. NIES-3974]